MTRDTGGAVQGERDARRRAEELVSEHVTARIAAPVAAYLRAVQERTDAEQRIATAEVAMRGAVTELRGLPGLSEQMIARLIQADTATVRRLGRRRGGGDAPRPART